MISLPGLPPATKPDRLKALLARCHNDPSLFAAAILGEAPFDLADPKQSPFWMRQHQASLMVAVYHTCIFPWGNALGKSWWAARLALWFLCTRRDSLVVTTAPIYDQLDSVLWKNIRAAIARSRIPLGIEPRRKPLRAALTNEWMLMGLATKRTERMSGHHAGQLLFLGDEASDLEPEIWEAADSLVPTKVVLIGNPLRAEGRFKDAWDEAEAQKQDRSIPNSERVVGLRVPSTESPDIHLDHSPRGMACGSWLRRMERKYGKDSLWIRTHVHALFPETAQDCLIPLAWLDACTAVRRPDQGSPFRDHAAGKIRMGIDLAEGCGADHTCLLIRDDFGILDVRTSATCDLAMAAQLAAELAARWRIAPEDITYDSQGMLGKSFVNHLHRYGLTKALPYKGNGTARERDRFANLRTECAYKLRQRLDPSGGGLPFAIPAREWWTRLREDLAALSYDLVGKKVRLIPKADWMVKLGRSPDTGDAILMTFAFSN